MKSIIARAKNNRLARNALWMLAGQGLGVVIQAVYFVLIARSLRSQGYGAFVGVVALVGILAPFSGLGSGNLLIKSVARDEESFSRCWGNALLMVLVSAGLLLLLILGLSQVVFPATIPFSLVFIIAVTELFFSRLLDISCQAFQAFQRMDRTAFLQFIPNVFKLVAIAILSITVREPTVMHWSYLYLAATVMSTLIGVWLVHKELGSPVFTLAGIKAEREGFYFSVSHSARLVYNDIDKTMLARFSTLEATGIYGAAYRIINVSFTPILSLLFAAYAKFFQSGAAGIGGSLAFAKKLFPVAGGYGVIVGIALVISSPLLPQILGAEYSDAAIALCWLAPLPFLKAVHFFTADALTGAGFQGVRSGIQVIVAVFNIVINLWLIPAYAWRGAAWASLASDGLLAVLMCVATLYIAAKSRQSALHSSPSADPAE